MIPEVICHIMGSVDGRLLPSRWSAPFGVSDSSSLFKQYGEIAQLLDADAWMFGKTTTAEFFPEKFTSKTVSHSRAGKVHIAPRESRRLFITADPDADILYSSSTLRGDNIVVILGTNASDDYLSMLEERGISYIILTDPTDLNTAMEILHEKFGVRRISLQGGGVIDGAMLAAGLLSELSLVVYPGIDGSAESPSIFEYIGKPGERPAAGQTMQLLSCELRQRGIVWLRYRFHHS